MCCSEEVSEAVRYYEFTTDAIVDSKPRENRAVAFRFPLPVTLQQNSDHKMEPSISSVRNTEPVSASAVDCDSLTPCERVSKDYRR